MISEAFLGYVSNAVAVRESLKVTHGACGAQRQVVHLLGERSHDSGGVDGQTGLDGRGGGDHSTLRAGQEGHTQWSASLWGCKWRGGRTNKDFTF